MWAFIWVSLAAFMATTVYSTEIIAHRGASRIAPENTLAAFKLAWRQGADACELDLRLSSDGTIVVLHDKDTKRTTGIFKIAARTPLAELKKLDAGSWKGDAYVEEPIPTLAEVLAITPPDKRLFLEIKCGPEIVPVLVAALASWESNANQICLIAFDRDVARKCKEAMPWFKVYRLSSEINRAGDRVDLNQLIADTKKDGLDGLNLSMNFAWGHLWKVRAANLELYLWTVNDPDTAKYLSSLGIKGITTDNPRMV